MKSCQNQQILTHCLLHQTRMTLVLKLHYPVFKTPHHLKKVNLSVSSSFHHNLEEDFPWPVAFFPFYTKSTTEYFLIQFGKYVKSLVTSIFKIERK